MLVQITKKYYCNSLYPFGFSLFIAYTPLWRNDSLICWWFYTFNFKLVGLCNVCQHTAGPYIYIGVWCALHMCFPVFCFIVNCVNYFIATEQFPLLNHELIKATSMYPVIHWHILQTTETLQMCFCIQMWILSFLAIPYHICSTFSQTFYIAYYRP